jgi:cephalosporin-C deacetylase-like acetyl esterase
MNYLKAVFWDYPQLTNREQLLKFIQESKKSKKVYRWLLKRFLEHARVVDTLEYFSLQEIALSYEGTSQAHRLF